MQEYLAQYLFLIASLTTTFLLPILLAYGWQALGRVRDERLKAYAELVVSAAQQAIPAKSDRYSYAAEALAKQFPGLNAKRVAELIEASVLAVKQSGPVVASNNPAPGLSATRTSPTRKPARAYTATDTDLSADPEANTKAVF